MLGNHLLRSWSKTQSNIALSSAESEFYATLKSAQESIGMMSMLREFLVDLEARVLVDASAALGVAQRQGVGKIRHLQTGALWMQEQELRRLLRLNKINGTENCSDLMTKNVSRELIARHCKAMSMEFKDGRAENAVQLHVMKKRIRQVKAEIKARKSGPRVKTLYNPFFQVADNLASCWMARKSMHQDFLLINGDTLFSPELLQTILAAPAKDIAVTIDQKGYYDGDDMKVTLDGSQLTAIGKTLPLTETDGESIGMLRFMDAGPKIFRNELKRLMKTSDGTKSWFLSAIHGLAQSGQHIDTINIKGAEWSELDTPEDYEICRSLFGESESARKRFAVI